MGFRSACVALAILLEHTVCLKLTPDTRMSEDPNHTMKLGAVKTLSLPFPPNEAPSTCDWNARLTQFLLDETKDRLELKFKLETKITELYNQIEGLKNLFVKQQEEIVFPAKDHAVAFSAEVESHLTGLTRDQTIVFASLRTNVASAYDPKTGVFSCPTPGLYLFSATILSNLGDRIETEIVLETTGGGRSSVAKLYSGGYGTARYGSGSNTVALELGKGDRVWVRVYNGLGSFIYKAWSSFTGVLIRPY